MILQKKFEKCENFLILHVYTTSTTKTYNLKTRVICCLTHNLQLTVI